LSAGLEDAAARDIPVVALTVGSSSLGGALVDAHSGALAGSDGGWQALFSAYGVRRVSDLAELVDTLELFAIGRRPLGTRSGIATVHDSGAERVLVADVAERVGVPFAPLATTTSTRLAASLDPWLTPANPLDVWGGGRDTEDLFTECLSALADDPEVDVVALAVDLVPEYDGDVAFPNAMARLLELTPKPVVVLANLAAAVDQAAAGRLRSLGIPVLEGTGSGLVALRHLRAPSPPPRWHPPLDGTRRERWIDRLGAERSCPGLAEALLTDYGIPVAPSRWVSCREDAIAAAADLGGTVALKTASGVSHKVDVDGVRLGLVGPNAVGAAYDDVAGRLGPYVQVQHQASAGVELSIGIVRDPLFGWLVVVGAGGTLVELLDESAVALAPVDPSAAAVLLGDTRAASLLAGWRGRPPVERAAVQSAVATISALSVVALELGDQLEVLEVNPLLVTPAGAVGVDALLR
ncbi:MAG: acetate--CoA ligase family protein, partial [Nocardioides sp.]